MSKKPNPKSKGSKPKPELPDPGQQLGAEQTSDNKLVAECPHCKHVWLEIIKVPMAVEAFSARIRAMSYCPKCGRPGAYMLLGDRYKEALDHFPFTKLEKETAEAFWIKSFADFRRSLRQALSNYCSNNLGSSDEELIGAVARLVAERKEEKSAKVQLYAGETGKNEPDPASQGDRKRSRKRADR